MEIQVPRLTPLAVYYSLGLKGVNAEARTHTHGSLHCLFCALHRSKMCAVVKIEG